MVTDGASQKGCGAVLRSRRMRFLHVLVNITSSALGVEDVATGDMNSGIRSSPGNKQE